ncbi:MAG TPA: helix-turn-helix domain-containing protein [Candidatus Saccharimonadales bacterium]|nr:helix-turn-helix domain-containing protein [Candidatus Saccharimonadales bacterium]
MYTQKESSLELINCVWHARVAHDGVYTDPANEYWSLGFIRHSSGFFSAELYGPSLQPRTLDGHTSEEYWGIEFRAHVALNSIRKGEILNAHMALRTVDMHFEIGDHQYVIPSYDDLENFAQQLQKDDVIMADSRLCRALRGNDTGFSERSRQRHFKSVTGLTKKQIEQLQRARHAFCLLQSGYSPARASQVSGYADQSHMTRSLKLLRGETPAQIIAAHLKRT